jgi:hemerythrin-like domain-containing protein
MLPVDLLVAEHRVIERIVKPMQEERERIAKTGLVDTNFIVRAVDFFRTYADQFHHGKEEAILFKELSQKKLSDEESKMMLELMMEHAYARKTVHALESAMEAFLAGKSELINDILKMLLALEELYPKHIQKEDEQFFYPAMKYFTQLEQEEMLNKFEDFDRNFINMKYQKIIKTLEAGSDK